MKDLKMENLTAPQLRDFINTHNEMDYVLVDVRQPAEYAVAHIPGARLLPLPELESKIDDLPADKDLLFYCRTGGRSLTAAFMAAEAEATTQTVYNILGGITAWEGKTLADFPRIQVFDKSKSHAELLLTAMDLEKGAWRFYNRVMEQYQDDPAPRTMEQLSKAEIAHAGMVYGFWEKLVDTPRPFEKLWDDLSGDILEGGENLEDMLARLEKLEGNLCLNLIDLSLYIEYSAFDLYRTMAEQSSDESARQAFLSIAQAETSHMRVLTHAIDQCG